MPVATIAEASGKREKSQSARMGGLAHRTSNPLSGAAADEQGYRGSKRTEVNATESEIRTKEGCETQSTKEDRRDEPHQSSSQATTDFSRRRYKPAAAGQRRTARDRVGCSANFKLGCFTGRGSS
jgi:hypothetical protein